jgi:hypothetical protein
MLHVCLALDFFIFFSAVILIVDLQILPPIKRTEMLKIRKYIHPSYFFMGSYRSTHDSGIKRASYSFKKLVWGRLPASLKGPIMQLNANALQNADNVMTSSIRAMSHCSVASKSRHIITSWCTVFWTSHQNLQPEQLCLAYIIITSWCTVFWPSHQNLQPG